MRINNIKNNNLEETIQAGDIVSFEFDDEFAVEGMVVETEDGLEIQLDEQGEEYLTELLPLAIGAAGAAWTAYDAYKAAQQLQRGEITQADLAKQIGTDAALTLAGGGVAKLAGKGFKAFRKWWKGDQGRQEPTLPKDMGPAPTGPNGRPLSPMSGREEPPVSSKNAPDTQRKQPTLTRKRPGATNLSGDSVSSKGTDFDAFLKNYGPKAQMSDDVQRLRQLAGLNEEKQQLNEFLNIAAAAATGAYNGYQIYNMVKDAYEDGSLSWRETGDILGKLALAGIETAAVGSGLGLIGKAGQGLMNIGKVFKQMPADTMRQAGQGVLRGMGQGVTDLAAELGRTGLKGASAGMTLAAVDNGAVGDAVSRGFNTALDTTDAVVSTAVDKVVDTGADIYQNIRNRNQANEDANRLRKLAGLNESTQLQENKIIRDLFKLIQDKIQEIRVKHAMGDISYPKATAGAGMGAGIGAMAASQMGKPDDQSPEEFFKLRLGESTLLEDISEQHLQEVLVEMGIEESLAGKLGKYALAAMLGLGAVKGMNDTSAKNTPLGQALDHAATNWSGEEAAQALELYKNIDAYADENDSTLRHWANQNQELVDQFKESVNEASSSADYGMFTPEGDAQVDKIVSGILRSFDAAAAAGDDLNRVRMLSHHQLETELEDLSDAGYDEALDTDVRERAAEHLDRGIERLMDLYESTSINESFSDQVKDFGMFSKGGNAQVQNIIQYTLNDFEDAAEKATESERDALRMEAMQKLFKELEDLAEDPKHEEAMDTDVRERAAAYLDKGIIRIMNVLDNQPVSESTRGLGSIDWPDTDEDGDSAMMQHAENAIRHGMHAHDAYDHVYSMTRERDWLSDNKDMIIDMFAQYGLQTEAAEKRWKQTSMSPEEAIKEFGKENVRVKKGALRNGDDMVEVFVEAELSEAEYQGKKVTLNKPIRTGKDEPKKFKVYVKDGDKVKMVRFGHQGKGNEKTMTIKKSDPERRKSFRARHNCDNPGPKTKARYWSCKAW